jgi:hypothetical protein
MGKERCHRCYNVWTGVRVTCSGIAVTMGAGQTKLLVLKAA